MKRMGYAFLLMMLVAGNACAFFAPPQLSRSATPLLPSQNFLYNANDQLSTDTYDANGNTLLSEIQVSGFTSQVSDSYDFRNRLIRRIEGDTELDYSYNARGTRIGKVKRIGGALVNRTLFVVDEQNLTGYAQTLEEWTDTGSGLHLAKTHTYGLDLISTTQSEIDPISGFRSQVSSFYCYDGHGSVRALADETGAITDTYSYDAFGNQLAQSGTTDNNYRYCGEYYDADLHLYYLRARHLNPNTGRFHTLDTYEGRNNDPLTLHKYLYAHANPLMNSDPSGFLTLMDVQESCKIQNILRRVKRHWRKLQQAKIAGVYSAFGFSRFVIIPHAFMYVKFKGSSIMKVYDVATNPMEAITKPLSIVGGRIYEDSMTKKELFLRPAFTKRVAKLSMLQYQVWRATVLKYPSGCSYGLLKGPNCITWTVKASLFAVAMQKVKI